MVPIPNLDATSSRDAIHNRLAIPNHVHHSTLRGRRASHASPCFRANHPNHHVPSHARHAIQS
jgi:hypothetical protein